ncbi:hypothetical protein BH11PSE8_BH11PSE8_08290 [soil metagenome]
MARAARALCGGLVAAAFTLPALAVPSPGHYAAQMCVSTVAGAPPNCGPADVQLRSGGKARVQIDDIVYHLQLFSSQIGVVLMHGAVQIDDFTADYEWAGAALKFTDIDRGARYELTLGARK